MKVEILVLDDGYREFKSRGETKKEYLFGGREFGTNPAEVCSNNLVIVATDEQKDKFAGKLMGRIVTATVKQISAAFNGDIRLVCSAIEPKGAIAVK
jgi:hypothetical protein